MKKLRIRMEVGKPIRLCNSYTLDRNPSISIELMDFIVTEGRAAYTLKVGHELIQGVHGSYHTLPLWENSWITMASPITINIGNGQFRPDFLAKVPNSIIRG